MKKSLCWIFCLIAGTFAAEVSKDSVLQAYDVKPIRQTILNRSGEYFQLSTGILRGTISFDQDAYFYGGKMTTEIQDFENYFSLKIGGIFRGLISIYGTYERSRSFAGNVDFDVRAKSNQQYKTIETYTIKEIRIHRWYLGLGMGVYPFRNIQSPLFGFYVNMEWRPILDSYSIEYGKSKYADENEQSRYRRYNNLDISADTYGFSLKIGKEWLLGSKLFYGVAFRMDIDESSSVYAKRGHYRYETNYKSTTSRYGLEFHLTWR